MRPASRGSSINTALCALAVLAVPGVWFARQYRQSNLNHALIDAIGKSDVAAVERLLGAGADPNSRESPYRHEAAMAQLSHWMHRPRVDLSPTALHLAIEGANVDGFDRSRTIAIVSALLNKGADANSIIDVRQKPLYMMFYCDQPDVIQRNQRDTQAYRDTCAPTNSAVIPVSPLVASVFCNCDECVPALLAHGADPNPKPSGFGTPLSLARSESKSSIVQLLESRGAKA